MENVFVLTDTPSLACHFIAEMRDSSIQSDALRFRKNMERVGELLAYEISKRLSYTPEPVATPLGVAVVPHLVEQPVLATILRAGLPLHQGLLNFFDKADSAFIGAYRGQHYEDYTFDIALEYIATPSLKDKVVLLIDPMLATGKSLVYAYQALLKYGKPKEVHVVSAIAARPGIAYLAIKMPEVKIWVGAIDEDLNDKFYIVPGLGDAGDLAFGKKL
jgi:uracil phosphoribosyltransferase